MTHRGEREIRDGNCEAHLPQRRAAEHERDRQEEQQRLEAALLEDVEIGGLPLGDEVLLHAGELGLDDVAVEVDPVRSHEPGDDAPDEDEYQVSRPPLVLIAINPARPVHGFDKRRDTDRHQAEEETAVEIRPGDHHQGEPVDRTRPASEVAVEPQQLEAREREGDHLWTRSPDSCPGQAGDADRDRGDHAVYVLEPDSAPHEQEPHERHRAECERHQCEPAELEHQVRDDLGCVLGIDPLLAGHREGEQILGDDLVVIDHPLAGDEMPEDVRITTSADQHAEDDHEGGDHQELSGRDAS